MNNKVTNTDIAPSVASVPGAATSLYAAPPSLARPFRILLVLPERIPAWVSTFLEQAAAIPWLEAWVLPVVGASLPKVTGLPLDLRAFLAFELARKGAIKPLILAPVPSCDATRIAPGASADSEGRRVVLRARKLQPDVVLSLGPPSWAEPLADVAPWGCWNIDASLVDPVSAGAALLAPMLQNASATPIELELQLERTWRAPASVAESVGATQRGSFTQQREKAFLKLPMLLLRTMRRLANSDLDVPKHHAALLRLKPSPVPLGMGSGVRALASVLHRTALWQLAKRRKPLPWVLLLREDSEPLDPAAPEVRSTSVIQAPPGIDYWADPCVVEDLGRRLVFVEEMTPSGKGIITCLELQERTVTRLGLAIEEPGHLSFPQLLRWNDEWYMTVESGALKRASLYRATGFPLEWSRVADLVTGRVFVDPILHFHGGHWYLFATVAENRNSTWDELFLFVSDQLTGPFRPHPANPILSDVRRARPAGRLFHHDGKLIRPSQDCASSYGSALVFNEVLELSPETYREEPISRLAPVWSRSLVACHTYSAAGGIELLDAKGIPSTGTPRLRVMHRPAKAFPASLVAPENPPSPAQAAMPMTGRGSLG